MSTTDPRPEGTLDSVDDVQTADPAARPAGDTSAAVAPPGYLVLHEIGHGGMGIVYRARDLSLDREVAIKLLREGYPLNSVAAARFVEEARITGQLQHPGIPAVHQVGTLADGRPFLAMKLVKGQTLDEQLRGRPDVAAERGRFLAVFEAVCNAVGYAHAHQVIHRDLKPNNIMVGAFGEVQVMDWGLAKVLGAERAFAAAGAAGPEVTVSQVQIHSARDAESATVAGSMLGTPAYMPPEQAGGEIDRIDAHADVFGLGAILCVVLTGKPPYTGKDAEAIRLAAIRGNVADALARLDGCGAEPELIALAKRCLAFEPEQRPANASELARAVASLRAQAEARARQAELDRARAEVHTAEQRKRRRVQLALAAAVVALLALLGGGLWYHDRQANERQAAADRNRLAARVALDQAEVALRQDNLVYGEIDAALTQARTRLADAGSPDLTQRFEELTRARYLLEQLDEIDQRRWQAATEGPGRLDTEYAQKTYPVRFRAYGLDLSAEAPEQLAERVRRSPIAPRLTAALNAWLEVGGPPRLLALLDALDPDPQRRDVRSAYARKDVKLIPAWAAKLDGHKLPPEFAQFVGGHPLTPQEHALRILTAAQATHPDHFGLANQTARRFKDDQPRERSAYYRIALALRPKNAVCWNNLGSALQGTKDLAGAEAAFRESVRLDPKNARPHAGLGNLLFDQKNYDGALAEFREASRLDPTFALPLNNIGNVLRLKRDFPGASAAYKKANQLDPKFVMPLVNLGNLLISQGKIDEGIAAFREATEKNPTFPNAHYVLGNALLKRKDLDGAITAYENTVKLVPGSAPACNKLAEALCLRGEPLAARQVLRDGLKRNPDWLNAPQLWVSYNIACSALQAVAGKEKRDTVKADPPALRREALGVLTADLAAWRVVWSADPVKNRGPVHSRMQYWLGDADLGIVRDVEKLPEPERARWRIFWEDVRKLRDETAAPRQQKKGQGRTPLSQAADRFANR
jgi:serine/threonine protein kinase/Flp pilus assembly protein TadD